MKQLLIATNNQHKFNEIYHFLQKKNIKIIDQQQFNIKSPPETGLTFVENAIIKARHSADITGLPTLADDSGIMVDQLDQAPGVYSARYSAKGTDYDNNIKLLDALNDTPWQLRRARFICILVLLKSANDPNPIIFHGQWQGKIINKEQFIAYKKSPTPFGYDPIFIADCNNKLVSDLSISEKVKYSHRGQCLRQLADYLS